MAWTSIYILLDATSTDIMEKTTCTHPWNLIWIPWIPTVERKIPILDDHGSAALSLRLCATVCKIYSTEFDHVFPNFDIHLSVAGWCLVVMSNWASRMAIFHTKWQAKQQLAGGCALPRFGGFSNQRCGCNFWPTKECLGKLFFLQLLTTKSHFFLMQSGEEKSPINQSDELISWYLENITYCTIFSRQLWLVMGVKLMEMNVTTCFPCRNNYMIFGRVLRDEKKTSPRKTWISRWWFQICLIFTPIWGRFPFWLIFFKWVETTNQIFVSQRSRNKKSQGFQKSPGGLDPAPLNQKNGGVIPGRPTTIFYRLASAPPLV